MARKQDMVGGTSGGQGTVTGGTKGSKGIGGIPAGAGAVPATGTKAYSGVGWPGDQDSRPDPSDPVQSG